MEETAKVAHAVYRLTVNIDEEDEALFEGLWPIASGVALHSYLVKGERLVLIDPWNAGGYGPEEIAADLEEWGLSWQDIAAVAFTKQPAAEFLKALQTFQPNLDFLGIPAAGARHDLGGVVLEEKGGFWTAGSTVFSGDAFAGLGWVEDDLWTETLGEHEARYFEDEALRWFASRPLVPALPPGAGAIVPAHGCLWKSGEAALERAQRFEAWGAAGLDEVAIVWPSVLVEAADELVGGALEAGAGVNLFRVPGDDPTALAAGARRSAFIVLAEGLDDSFLRGLEKEVWRPKATTPPADLRAELIRRWNL